MNFSNLWKGLAVVAVLFLLSMEASAQLPVRTQSLQLINPTGGATLTQNVNTGVAGTSYTVTWPGTPNHPTAAPALNDEAILIGTWDGTNTWDLRWEQSDGFVDGDGATNHVTFWNPDNNTLESQENFEFNPATGRLGIGMNDIASVGATIIAGTSGSVAIGDGTNAQVQLNVVAGEGTFGNATTAGSLIVTSAGGVTTVDADGATATVTIGTTAAGIGGSVVVNDGTGTVGIDLDGATGTGTFGNATIDGEVVISDGSSHAVTLGTAGQPGNFDINVNPITDVANNAGAGYNTAPITNAIAIDNSMNNYLLTANGDGTATWETNPFAGLERGIADPTDGAYSFDVVTTAIPDGNDVILVSVVDVTGTPTGNILAVTGFGAAPNDFTVSAAGPFTGTERIAWILIPIP